MRTLGNSGIQVSTIGLGCNNFGRKGTATQGQDGTNAVVHAAIDHGITFFDTADIYGNPPTSSESLMGIALEGRRDEVVLATKWGHADVALAGTEGWGPKAERRYIRNAVDASLTRLRTDRIDLYQLHTPHPETSIETTVDALEELIDEGKILAYGHSNFSAEQIREAASVGAAHGFSTAQNEYNLLTRGVESEVLPAAREAGLGFLPFFPLANGLLTGKYSATERPEGARLTQLKPELFDRVDWTKIEAYRALPHEAGISMLAATFQWLLAQSPVSSVIAGATRIEQVAANAEAGAAQLSDELVAKISAIFAE